MAPIAPASMAMAPMTWAPSSLSDLTHSAAIHLPRPKSIPALVKWNYHCPRTRIDFAIRPMPLATQFPLSKKGQVRQAACSLSDSARSTAPLFIGIGRSRSIFSIRASVKWDHHFPQTRPDLVIRPMPLATNGRVRQTARTCAWLMHGHRCGAAHMLMGRSTIAPSICG
jgi:hypothetical protein